MFLVIIHIAWGIVNQKIASLSGKRLKTDHTRPKAAGMAA
jgi:hypothetical protein